ncbi:putative baseplate assembly protein [Variovorax sp. J22R133]|uniref:putative baseplate assembly protein n=1 Tax=Variovorax brevis TaxID=3053503 RepID=UPI002574C7D1|nr:putative baseplate assembly protein [Variovorax sp. J22R133]MDM0112232.1 putative baseplate assembly protein [Variovorax sp. J22R133]
MSGQYLCHAPGRVDALRDAAQASPARLLNGIHYLEVAPGHRRLEVHFVFPLDVVPTTPLKVSNVEIRGGFRVRDPQVTAISWHDDVLVVDVATAGDFSRYTLRLVASAGEAAPPQDIDPALAQIEFSFKVDCPSDFDCRIDTSCPPEPTRPPAIDYLARDYQSFRRLVLDRLSSLMPGWRERNPADLWVTLAEAVAFRGDELSYFQDAVATEAYLGTARQRVSVRRHTRLLDYAFHDGRNARAWVCFEADASADSTSLAGCDPSTGIGGTLLLTRVPGLPVSIGADAVQSAIDAGAQPFELLENLTLYTAHNAMRFHTWSDDECCLPQGATQAFLKDDEANRLRLRVGDVLILESLKSTATGEAVDADRQQRHAVRLTRVDPEAPLSGGVRGVPSLRRDPVTDQAFVEIAWGADDALPFALCLSKRIGGALVDEMAGACGNVALADHGRTSNRVDALTPLPAAPTARIARYPLDRTAIAPLTQQGRVRLADSDETLLVDASASASAAMQGDIADVRPAIDVRSEGDRRLWRSQRDLLGSGPEASEFVVETENDGHAVLRFGDGVNGRAPLAGEGLFALLRTGNGLAGNVGAEAIGHVVGLGITRVRNPLPAQGGIDPQPMSLAKLYAPQAFRRQERAVTAADYAEVTQREARVQRAVATRRWTGSWYTMFITVDPRGGDAVDAELEADLVRFIERYRLAGHDIEIDAPSFVSLDIELHVCTKAGYFVADVERRLITAFGAGRLPTGGTGFFHPDNFSFGQGVYLSAVIATAMAVPGVAYVTPAKFQRLGRNAAGEIDAGRVPMARLEIARLDNDPNAPENGRIKFDVHTGT